MAGLQISRKDLERYKSQALGARKRLSKVKDKADNAAQALVRTAEVNASAMALGMFRGRYNVDAVMGVAPELAVGVGLHALGLMGVGGESSTHLHNLGDGALAAHTFSMGQAMGKKLLEAPKTPKKTPAKTALKGSTLQGEVIDGERLSEEDLEAMAGGKVA